MSPVTRFDGTIPEYYDRFLGPVIFDGPALDLASRLATGPGMRVLEVAAGTGIVTRRLLAVLPADARLQATDLNPEMLAHARTRLPDDARLEWRTADAQELPFGDGSFDAWVCQFGVMFFPDKARAFREAHRVLVPGGRLLFNVWCDHAHNAFGRIADTAIASCFPDDPPLFYRTPFGWCDEAVILATLSAAGFHAPRIERLELPGRADSAAGLATGIVRGNPIAHEILQRGGAGIPEVEGAVAGALAAHGGERPWESVLRALVVSAER